MIPHKHLSWVEIKLNFIYKSSKLLISGERSYFKGSNISGIYAKILIPLNSLLKYYH
jgi:hypothetical protein